MGAFIPYQQGLSWTWHSEFHIYSVFKKLHEKETWKLSNGSGPTIKSEMMLPNCDVTQYEHWLNII